MWTLYGYLVIGFLWAIYCSYKQTEYIIEYTAMYKWYLRLSMIVVNTFTWPYSMYRVYELSKYKWRKP